MVFVTMATVVGAVVVAVAQLLLAMFIVASPDRILAYNSSNFVDNGLAQGTAALLLSQTPPRWPSGKAFVSSAGDCGSAPLSLRSRHATGLRPSRTGWPGVSIR